MADSELDEACLTPGAERLVALALQKQHDARQAVLGLHHWLLALLERHGAMAESAAPGLTAAERQRRLQEQIQKGDTGARLDRDAVLRQALQRAQARGLPQASERDLAAVILAAAGYPQQGPPVSAATPVPTAEAGPAAEASAGYRPRAAHPTPTLDQYGRDLTAQALAGKLSPLIGREDELELIVETLCRRSKRNPVLVGPAGVGKTAIIEGLAQRVVRGEVPAVLRGVRIVALQPSTLVAGASVAGELEKRMRGVLAEASRDGIILFIDEMHAMVGAGGMPGTGDVASQLKPALARGDLACIAATTDDEYRRFVEPDSALERRFQPVRVQELTAGQTLRVLEVLRDEFRRLRQVDVPDATLSWLVHFSQRYLRNRYFPDKAVDLLEQCVAYALTQGKAAVGLAEAQAVAQRMVGMPVDPAGGIARLEAELDGRALLAEADAHAFLGRLAVTLRGLDLRPSRPNAVLLLVGEAAQGAEPLSEAVALALFGATERVVAIDLSRMVHPEDVTLLVGAPPGYVGYSDSLPLHRVAQMPWCVLRLENLAACHPQIRTVLTQALSDGFFTDGRGKRIYLSDAVVLLTANVGEAARGPLGFCRPAQAAEGDARAAAEEALGVELVAQADLVCAHAPSSAEAGRRWLTDTLLPDLARRYRERRVEFAWDGSLVDWLLGQRSAHQGLRGWERLLDEALSPALIPYLPSGEAEEGASYRVRVEAGVIVVEACERPGGEPCP